MAYMDFIILKVNGTDVSGFPHEDAVKTFLDAQEPIVVEVKRRFSNKSTETSSDPNTESTPIATPRKSEQLIPDEGISEAAKTVEEEDDYDGFVSTAVQTDLSGFGWYDTSPMEDCHRYDLDMEEVTLQKCNSEERLGLTVCYSSGSSSEEVDNCIEVYIRDILPESVADRDGRLKEGDQILQVNGKDVSNKEDTESLFAESQKTVTLLVSRCVYQADDIDYQQNTPMIEAETPEYQNSLIEQLIKEQAEHAQIEENASKLLSPQISPEHKLEPPLPPTKPDIPEKPKITAKQILNNTNSLVRSQIDSINHELSLLNNRMQNIHLVNKDIKRKPPQLPHIPCPPESDTEHIYETIPENGDSEIEPIYSSPYESSDQNILEQWLKDQDNIWKNGKKTTTKIEKLTKGSDEEHENSSSAYNTGGSCNSNPLTFELTRNANPWEKTGSTLVLCNPNERDELAHPPTVDKVIIKTEKEHCEKCRQQSAKPKKTKIPNSKVTSPLSPSSHQQFITQTEPHSLKKLQTLPAHIPADTMYTNVANLQQTMLLQQQLFRQALSRQSTSKEQRFEYRDVAMKPTTSFTAPSLTQYRYVSSKQVYSNSTDLKTVNTGMEWKVKKRQDGTRYIARRPVRNKILKNRAIRISEERAGLTTEDDTVSELKIGRYWTKEERKAQAERNREKKHRMELLTASKFIPVEDHNEHADQLCKLPDKIHMTAGSINKKSSLHVDLKKTKSKKQSQDFQDMIVHGPKMTTSPTNKMVGLLSVTTV